MLELVAPSESFRRSYLDAVAEFADDGSSIAITDDTFSRWLMRLVDDSAGRNLATGRVPATELWLVEGDHYIGRVSIRHVLNDALRLVGGHIGYAIRPSCRRRGHGTKLLALTLPRARALGIDPALVTCDSTNVASRKIIEACGGVLDGKPTTAGQPDKLRYWVPT